MSRSIAFEESQYLLLTSVYYNSCCFKTCQNQMISEPAKRKNRDSPCKAAFFTGWEQPIRARLLSYTQTGMEVEHHLLGIRRVFGLISWLIRFLAMPSTSAHDDSRKWTVALNTDSSTILHVSHRVPIRHRSVTVAEECFSFVFRWWGVESWSKMRMEVQRACTVQLVHIYTICTLAQGSSD